MRWRRSSGAVRRALALMPINIQLRMDCARFEWSGPKIAPDGRRLVVHHLQLRTISRAVGNRQLQRVFKCVMQAHSRCPNHLHHVTSSAGRWATSSCSGCSSVSCRLSRCPNHLHYVTLLQRSFKCVMQAQPLPQPPALCHTICSTKGKNRNPSGSRHLKCSCCIPPKRKSHCTQCNGGGGSICPHDRQRNWCLECGGKARCSHGIQRSKCPECGGSGLCSHGKVRCRCRQCRNL